jgi:hypothetical protein
MSNLCNDIVISILKMDKCLVKRYEQIRRFVKYVEFVLKLGKKIYQNNPNSMIMPSSL